MKRLGLILVLELLLVLALRPTAQAVETEMVLRARIVSLLALDTTTHQVEILGHGFPKEISDSAQLDLIPRSALPDKGLINIGASLITPGADKTTSQVQARIRVFQDVYVSLTSLNKSSIPEATTVGLEHREITSLNDLPVTDLAVLDGLRLKRTVGRGQILTRSMLEPIPDIERGDEVTIQCGMGGFTITASGEAMGTGSAGETIKVKNKTSGKLILARVLDGHTVALAP